jgi:pimeloyl-ACP methyl ester carboxylesterase
MKLKLPKAKRAARWVVILLLVAVIGFFLVLPTVFAVVVVFPHQGSVGSPPEGFEAVTLTTSDKVTLGAWYKPPTNGAVIILIHGAGGSRENLRRYADLLVQHGYGVLALDLRGHGSSDGTTNRLGWQGTRDVGAAVAYLEGREEVIAIGGMGISLGSEVLLGAASTYPAIRAIVADGPTNRSLDEGRVLESERPVSRKVFEGVFYTMVQLLSGDDPPDPPLLDSMVAAESTTFLLIAGGANKEEVRFNEVFAETIGERAVLWVAPDAKHTGAFRRYPAEYEKRVTAFLDAALTGSVD